MRAWSRRDLAVETLLSSGYSLLQSIPRTSLARRVSLTGSSPGLWLPTAHEETRSCLGRASKPTRLRLQGLATLLTFSSSRVPAGFISLRRRSWDSPFEAFPLSRVSRHSCGDEPTCGSPGYLSSKTASCWKGLLRRLLGFDPGTSPSSISGLQGPSSTGCSLGFLPF